MTFLPHTNKIILPFTKTYKDNYESKSFGNFYSQGIQKGTIQKLYLATLKFKNLSYSEFRELVIFIKETGYGQIVQMQLPYFNVFELVTFQDGSFSSKGRDEISISIMEHYTSSQFSGNSINSPTNLVGVSL